MFSAIPINGQTWLICGGRRFHHRDLFNNAMSDLVHSLGMPDTIIHGLALGADKMAEDWGNRHACSIRRFKADWDKYGKAAGPIRNQQMIDMGKPDLVIAFPGGRGTADMVERAREAGIDVAEIKVT